MKVYDQQHIKNVVLLGGAKSGKTTLAETMMYEAKLINRRGSIENKNTVSDFHDVEECEVYLFTPRPSTLNGAIIKSTLSTRLDWMIF